MFNGLQHTNRRGEQYSEVMSMETTAIGKHAISMSRSSKWSSALRGRMLEGAMENNKDGN